MISDESFHLQSARAQEALKSAKSLLQWLLIEKNTNRTDVFLELLFADLDKCLDDKKRWMHKMWEKFHKLRISEQFNKRWVKFLGYSGGDAAKDPILYQHLTQLLLERRVKEHYPVAEEQSKQKETLDFQEANSVRYIAGYVIRALKKKLLRMSNPLQKELDLCLSEMLDAVYTFFVSMEMEVRQHLDKGSEECGIKEVAMSGIRE